MTIFVPGADTALILVDVQNDFLPGGTLAVPDGDGVIAPLNRLVTFAFGCVVATQDWHPVDHMSFTAQGGPWPEHCIAATTGAALAPTLDRRMITHIVHKGAARERDSYSGFFDNAGGTSTGLDGLLRALGIRRVVIGGLAFDYCVAATARDAARLGFETTVALDAVRAVQGPQWDYCKEFAGSDVAFIQSTDIRAE